MFVLLVPQCEYSTHWTKSRSKVAFAICQFAFSIKFLAYVVIFMSEERRERRELALVPWLENEDKFYVARKLRTLFIALANACPFADVATNICQGPWESGGTL